MSVVVVNILLILYLLVCAHLLVSIRAQQTPVSDTDNFNYNCSIISRDNNYELLRCFHKH